MFIFGYIGNYFWTHYFFNLLGAAYTFPSFKLNQVWREGGGCYGPTTCVWGDACACSWHARLSALRLITPTY